MPAEGSKRIEKSFARIVKISHAIYGVLMALFLMAVVAGIICIIFPIISEMLSGVPSVKLSETHPALGIVPFIMLWIITSLSLWITCCIFKDISHGISPFSKKHAKRLRILGIITLGSMIVEALVSPDVSSTIHAGAVVISANFSEPPRYPYIPINAQSLVSSIFCICLSLVFEYGSLLQKLSDDTI